MISIFLDTISDVVYSIRNLDLFILLLGVVIVAAVVSYTVRLIRGI